MLKKIKGTSVLSDEEERKINELIDKGNTLLDKLNSECTFELLKKLIVNYARAVNEKRRFINSLIERTLEPEPDISVRINDLITKTNELISFLKKADVIDKYAPALIKKLEELLARYKVFVDFSYSIKYTLQKSVVKKHKIVLSLNDLSLGRLVQLIIYSNNKAMKGFLFTDEDLIESKVVENFLSGVNIENLKIALKKDKHGEFLMKLYVLLSYQCRKIKGLVKTMNSHLVAADYTSLDLNVSFVKKELESVAADLVKSLKIVEKSRLKGIKTESLVNIYDESTLISKGRDALKAYLRSKINIDDLPNQFIYEFLVAYDVVPEWLKDYSDFVKRSPYLFLKSFFS